MHEHNNHPCSSEKKTSMAIATVRNTQRSIVYTAPTPTGSITTSTGSPAWTTRRPLKKGTPTSDASCTIANKTHADLQLALATLNPITARNLLDQSTAARTTAIDSQLESCRTECTYQGSTSLFLIISYARATYFISCLSDLCIDYL